MQGSRCRLKDILWVDGRGKVREADEITLRPGEIEMSRTAGGKLRYALLFETGCVWISVEVPKLQRKSSPNGHSGGAGLMLPVVSEPWHSMGTHEGWFLYGREATTSPNIVLSGASEGIVPSPEAIAIVGNAPFTIDHVRICDIRRPFAPEGYGIYRIILLLPLGEREQEELKGPFQYYIAWGATLEEATTRALYTAKENRKEQHRQRIETLFKGFSWDMGDPLVNKAIGWAAFSGWSLVTRVQGKGIWAGLPWFRDNWGRDTFIALPGILLVSGQFHEAREIITTFAGWQDTNPGSPTYGRIPNRWRSPEDVIYNTVDGTLWFIREVWEYGQYTGDLAFLHSMAEVVFQALDADMDRCDTFHFLLHDHADTWMDARIRGKEPWSERGSRAVEVQALWYTALCCGAALAHLAGDFQRESRYQEFARTLKENFRRYFWYPEYGRLADRLLPQDSNEEPSETAADLRCRPNGLIALLATAILPQEDQLLPEEIMQQVLVDAVQNLLYPYGIASLSQEDPLFHPHHEWPGQYHKDAAYHNGTIWQWNAGAVIYALLRFGKGDIAWQLTKELARQIMQEGAAGTLGENLHAHPSADGRIIHSGTYSQAWSVSEYTRTIFQDWLGIRPRLLENKLIVAPQLPPGHNRVVGSQQAGPWHISVGLSKGQNCLHYTLKVEEKGNPSAGAVFDAPQRVTQGDPFSSQSPGPPLLEIQVLHEGIERIWQFHVEQGKSYEVTLNLDTMEFSYLSGEKKRPTCIRPVLKHRFFSDLPDLSFCVPRLPPWNLPFRCRNALEKAILGNTYNGGPIAILKEWYDSADFARQFHTDERLGARYRPEATEFKLWSPVAQEVQLCLYEQGTGGSPFAIVPMHISPRGVWSCQVAGDLHGTYYTYRLRIFSLFRETIDPYAITSGVNGQRGMVVDLSRLEPEGWNSFTTPTLAKANNAIIWEAHIRDLTCHPTWQGPEELRGTFLGAATKGTSYQDASGTGIPTGLDYLKALGITHVQLLPIFDFVSVDETRVREPEYRNRKEGGAFNWGYDPGNYGVPEGSYATNPFDGACRIRELRQLVLALGQAGMGVIMDVVYNHVPDFRRSALEACVPGYYFRGRRDSGAGDDTASERYMFRKYMKDTLIHWITTYKLCGFRFDLMGLHDVHTMREIEKALRHRKPDILLYGEGWDMCGLSRPVMASQRNIHLLKGIGMFNDAFRDGVKGSVFHASEGGWIHGESGWEEAVKFGLVGAVRHPQVHNKKVIGTARPGPWSEYTWKSINYLEVHDNLTLFDKLQLVEPGQSMDYYEGMQRFAMTLLFCSQGIVLMHGGMEFCRTKEVPAQWIQEGGIDKCVALTEQNGGEDFAPAGGGLPQNLSVRLFCHDSYKAGDLLNSLNWERALQHRETVAYVRGLIALRKKHPLLRLERGKEVRRALRFMSSPPGTLVWHLDGQRIRKKEAPLLIVANHNRTAVPVILPGGQWEILAESSEAFINWVALGEDSIAGVYVQEPYRKAHAPQRVEPLAVGDPPQVKASPLVSATLLAAPRSCLILRR
ncbi:type I pullulanase [Treponema sp. J25]|uniref:type I pullulanase n=1 Tax=Treponema sp. J25 TaxID=2094121 RepID=UPI001048EEB4|nr:type I pullulanase [Treponema sp. J25]TCW61941.1 type I pullulanase [Treponema sp. J25]